MSTEALKREINNLLLLQFHMMMERLFSTGADFEMSANDGCSADYVTPIPEWCSDEYGMRVVASASRDDNHFDIDAECIGALGECVTKNNGDTRFAVGISENDFEDYWCTNDSADFHYISMTFPARITDTELAAIRNDLESIVLMQRLRHPN